MWLRFQNFPLLYTGRECYAEASTTSNNANNVKLSTTAVMVDNLAEKVERSNGASAIHGLLEY